MTDDEAKDTPKESPWVPVVWCLIMLIVFPVFIWCTWFAMAWICFNLPWDIPNPIFLADCLSTGSKWACDRV